MTQRFFHCDPDAYEAARIALDAALPMPPGETVYEPLATAPRREDGRVVVAFHAGDCDRPPYLAFLAAALADGTAVEISEEDYLAVVLLPPDADAGAA